MLYAFEAKGKSYPKRKLQLRREYPGLSGNTNLEPQEYAKTLQSSINSIYAVMRKTASNASEVGQFT